MKDISALDVLRDVFEVQFTPNEEATGHPGAIYMTKKAAAGVLPMCTPDCITISEDMRIAWRYHNASKNERSIKYGPLKASSCISKAKSVTGSFDDFIRLRFALSLQEIPCRQLLLRSL